MMSQVRYLKALEDYRSKIGRELEDASASGCREVLEPCKIMLYEKEHLEDTFPI